MMPCREPSLRILLSAVLLALGCARATLPGPRGDAPNLAEFVPSPVEVVDRMLELAGVTRDDVVYDLGSGDGRIVITAAKRFGARGIGVEIDPRLVSFSRENAQRERVAHLVTFQNEDATTVDISAATVVTLYLSPQANRLLRPKLLRELESGARVVSHSHDMGDWTPDATERVTARTGQVHVLYLWRLRK
jgi:SAM-dependent methyltransferase